MQNSKQTGAVVGTKKAAIRDWSALLVIILPCMVYSMDLTILNFALPVLSAELRPTAPQLLWIVDIYGFMVAAFLVSMGNLGDRIGRRLLLLVGAGFFAVTSIACAVAESPEMLIVGRAFLGIAGATLAPSTLSLIRNIFHDEQERRFAIGVWVIGFSAGGSIGPLVGGVLIEHFWWGSVFLPAVPIMLLLLIVGPVLLPEYRDPKAQPIDFVSVILSACSILGLVYGLKQWSDHRLEWTSVAFALIGLATGRVFLKRQRVLAFPLIDLTLFEQAKFGAAILAYGITCFAMFGCYLFITQYLLLVAKLSPLAAGMATIPMSIGFVAGSLISPILARRCSHFSLLMCGMLVGSGGFAMLATLQGPAALPFQIFATVILSLGLSPVLTFANDMILAAAPPERAGAASAISETASELCGAIGIAVLGSLGTLVYQHQLSVAWPEQISQATLSEAKATVGSALAIAHSMPGTSGTELAELARGAFVDAMHAAALAGACVLVGGAALVSRLIRVRPVKAS